MDGGVRVTSWYDSLETAKSDMLVYAQDKNLSILSFQVVTKGVLRTKFAIIFSWVYPKDIEENEI